ncbi:hypothetical protein QUF58_11830 [Anaerolineales bacterium HSG24]|nr:hypothetical protein [Anaerolineales bacterium HSG24]
MDTNVILQYLPYLFFAGATVMGSALALASLLLIWVIWQIKKIDLPPNADFKTALLSTPLVVVILLDLLDVGLNFMSAPVGWTILTYLGLHPLRGVAVVEGFLPGTEALPTMTVAWIGVRLFKNRLP